MKTSSNKGNLCKNRVFIYQVKRTAATLLTACETTAKDFCWRHKKLTTFWGESTRPLIKRITFPLLDGFLFLFIYIRQVGFSYHLLFYRPFTVSLVCMQATWIKLFYRKTGPAAMWLPLLHYCASMKRMANIRALPAMFSSVRNGSGQWTLNYSSDCLFMKYMTHCQFEYQQLQP